MTSWRIHEAHCRGLVRHVNERVAELAQLFGCAGTGAEGLLLLVCECGDLSCIERVQITAAAYAEIRSSPRRFLIAPNHEDPELEAVLLETAQYTVVETLAGEASRLAEETDPRRRSGSAVASIRPARTAADKRFLPRPSTTTRSAR